MKVGEEATCVDWRPDGGSLATGSVDQTVQVLDITVLSDVSVVGTGIDPVTSRFSGARSTN